jgi:hypothetical protein
MRFAVACPTNQNFHTSLRRPSVHTVRSTATLRRYSISGHLRGCISTAIAATVTLIHLLSNDTILGPTLNKHFFINPTDKTCGERSGLHGAAVLVCQFVIHQLGTLTFIVFSTSWQLEWRTVLLKQLSPFPSPYPFAPPQSSHLLRAINMLKDKNCNIYK